MNFFGTLAFGPDDDPDNDGHTNAEELADGTHPNEFTDSCPAPIGELGMACIKSGVTNTIPFRLNYANPIVVAQSLSSQEREPAVCRISTTTTGFEIQLMELAYQDGNHTEELVSYMVVEAGHHELHDGRFIEAGRVQISSQTNVSYQTAFPKPPIVFAHIHDAVEAEPAFERVWNTFRARFTIQLDEAETPVTPGRVPESVNFIAISTGTTMTVEGQMACATTPRSFDHNNTLIQFPAAFPSRPVFLVQKDSKRGGNPAQTRFDQLNRDSVEVYLLEEQSRDNEIAHNKAEIAWLAAPRGLLYANQWSSCPGGLLSADHDGDGLFGDQEQTNGTNPALYDSDGDGHNDATEVSFGSDPLNPNDQPTSRVTLNLFQPSTTCCW